jgi:hypothetical protein
MTQDYWDLKVGMELLDMHYVNVVGDPARFLFRAPYASDGFQQHYDLRNVVRFYITPHYTRGSPIAGQGLFTDWLGQVARAADAFYTNKMLIVVHMPWHDSEWWPCAWSYDSSFGGVCEVRRKP